VSIPVGRRPISPAAKRIAQELDIEITKVPGSGEDGLVTEKDVRAFAVGQSSPVTTESEDAQVIPLTGQRRIASAWHSVAVQRRYDHGDRRDMGQIVAVRASTKFSYTAYVAWAASQALHEFPLLNAWITEDRIIVKSSVHMGVAVAIEGALVVPVIRHAENMNVGEIDQAINALGAKARAGQLTPDDMKGSTFTVTNSGVFGSLFFTPIINLPEVAVLGMGKVAEAAVVRDSAVVVSKVMYLCLSYDHRAVDVTAVQFLRLSELLKTRRIATRAVPQGAARSKVNRHGIY
jgi:pyruvate/2-oxoglutarate dehydrogenase complex dihydrolipoamide acyltransferase (E2) component